MSSQAADSWNLRELAAEADRRGLPLRIDDLRRACREGRLQASKKRGAWVLTVAEAARFLAQETCAHSLAVTGSTADFEPKPASSPTLETPEPSSMAMGSCVTARQLAFESQSANLARHADARVQEDAGLGKPANQILASGEEDSEVSGDVVDFGVVFEPCDEEVEDALDWSSFEGVDFIASDEAEDEGAEQHLASALSALATLRLEAEGWSHQPGLQAKAPAAVERRALKRRSLFRTVVQESPRACDLAVKMREFDRRRREAVARNAEFNDLAERSFEALMHLAEEAGHCAATHAHAKTKELEADLDAGVDEVDDAVALVEEESSFALCSSAELLDENPSEDEAAELRPRVIEERDEEGRLLSRLEVVESPQVQQDVDDDDAFIAEGAYVAFHADGSEAARGFYVAGALEGSWRQWHPSGSPAVTGQHRSGRPEGDWVFFHANGVKAREGRFEGGAPIGIWRSWDRRGRLLAETGELVAAR